MHFGRFNRTVLELAYVTLVLMSILNGLTKSGFGVELLVKVVFRGKGINDDNEYKSINAHVGAFICVGLVSVALTGRLNSAAHGSIISLGATTHTHSHTHKNIRKACFSSVITVKKEALLHFPTEERWILQLGSF